jgi:hypothetical protein
MATLNRFPLLGLWAAEAARRLGYLKDDAEAVGHAYAVLYAIRARPRTHGPSEPGGQATAVQAKRRASHRIHFGGADLDVGYDVDGRLRGKVGGGRPQTAASYRAAVRAKFPDGYYERLKKAFRDLLKSCPPRVLRGRSVYDLYDEWKRACAVGRLVDLGRLLEWCRRRSSVPSARSA